MVLANLIIQLTSLATFFCLELMQANDNFLAIAEIPGNVSANVVYFSRNDHFPSRITLNITEI